MSTSPRLTHTQRDAFVRAVMDDVPSVDYKRQHKEAIEKYFEKVMPKEIAALLPKFGDWIRRKTIYTTSLFDTVYVYSDGGSIHAHSIEALKKILDPIEKAAVEQQKEHGAISQKVRAAIYGCTTIKQAQEAFPEFIKYLPATPERAIRTLPAVANLVADLTKAGWPKDKPAFAAPTTPEAHRSGEGCSKVLSATPQSRNELEHQ